MRDLLRIVIVDDEKFIREALRRMIDWEQLGMQVIGYCKNGVEAYNYILDEYPDIVLTDIKIPGMDGIELIDQIKKVDSDIEFIILSGYGEFEFAQRAMSYGIRHYLLKPCDEKKIVECLRAVSASIYEKRGRNANVQIGNAADRNHKTHKIIRQIIDYIDAHLSAPEMTLKWFAQNYVYMNADYLSKVFYQETGTKFSDYVNQKRVDYAKKMIQDDPDITLNEIAREVGFADNPFYFSKVFKKYCSMTLTDYRQGKYSK